MVITFKNVSFNYTNRPLLDSVNLNITDNDKIGLVGLNGTGKSTLIKLIMEEINPLKGEIIKSGKMIVSYLPQDPLIEDNISSRDYLLKTLDKEHPVKEYEVDAILTKFKLDPKALTTYLSGGQKRRLALAKALVTYCDFLILDEPTNHLDNDMILYLEKYLMRFNHGLFMVTHDRYFLERCCNTMFELDNGHIYTYKANYSEFLKLKDERLENEAKEEKKLKALLKTELEWMNRGVEARRTKQKYRIERFQELSKIKFSKREDFTFESVKTYLGRNIIEIKDGSKSYGEKVIFKDLNLALLRTDHIGIVGDNGCGKTTLFKIIMGEETLDKGELNLGETLNIGYFSQHFDAIDPDIRVIDYIKEETNEIETLDGKLTATGLLDKFLFDKNLQYSLVKSLSGGQKRRLQLVRVLAKNPNILLLDEPTNDLDIYTLEILENYLNSFMGPILCVSHDRYFLDKICDKLLYYDHHYVKPFNGTFSEFLEKDLVTNEVKEKVLVNAPKPKKVIFSYNEKREFETLEKEVNELENKLSNLNNELSKVTTDYQKIIELERDLSKFNELYEEKSLRYLELLEKKESLES